MIAQSCLTKKSCGNEMNILKFAVSGLSALAKVMTILWRNKMHKSDVPTMGFLALCALVAWGIGYLITIDMEYSLQLKEHCIAVGKQIVEGNCINE